MTTKKFADFIEKQARSILNVSAEPIFGEYILTRNGKKIGVLNQNQCIFFLPTKRKSCCLMQKSVVLISTHPENRILYW